MDDLINTMTIRSPGIDPGKPHIEDIPFTDAELVAIRNHIGQVTMGECSSHDSATGLRKLWLLINKWQDNSP
jgi:hypothetical protein